MGVVGSKSTLERRNTVLRRSQRKSIHGVKSKAEKLAKDIKKFKGTEENTDYIELKARIESAERELRNQSKTLQLQTRQIYDQAFKKTEECHKLLSDKLTENQDKLREAQQKELEKQQKELEKQAEKDEEEEEKPDDNDDDDDVFIEEVIEGSNEPQDSTLKRKTVELNVIQIEASPQINKRFSAMKIGVPVLPGTMMESLHKKNEELNLKTEQRISAIRREIEKIEIEISQFVGKKNGRYYNKIRLQLEGYTDELRNISSSDEDIQEQVKLCGNYVASCLSFLNEKAVGDDDVDDDDDDDYDDVMSSVSEPRASQVDNNLSPRNMRTTYI